MVPEYLRQQPVAELMHWRAEPGRPEDALPAPGADVAPVDLLLDVVEREPEQEEDAEQADQLRGYGLGKKNK